MRRFRPPLLAILPVTVVAFVLAVPLFCGIHPLRWQSSSPLPHLVIGHSRGGSSPPPSLVAPSTAAAAPEAAPDVRVGTPWRPGTPQWGVQLYWKDDPRQSAASITRQAWIQARYLVGLGANSVTISFPFYTGTVISDEITARPGTPSPQRLAAVLDVLHHAGLRITVRPLMDETSLGGLPNWRGSIRPADRDAWFAAYRGFLIPYLDVAQRHHVATFTIGTELSSMEGDPRWQALVDTAARHFAGELSYDANWDAYVADPVSIPVGHLGVDAYFPVRAPDTASVGTLVASWNAWLNRKSTSALPRITLSEAGIAATDGAYSAPGAPNATRQINPQVQANWYTAVCRVVRQRHMAGVYWWFLSFADNPNTPPTRADSRLDFAGRPRTEQAIRACFTARP